MASRLGEHSTQEPYISWTCMKTLNCTNHADSEEILTNGSHHYLPSKTAGCTEFGEVPKKHIDYGSEGYSLNVSNQ